MQRNVSIQQTLPPLPLEVDLWKFLMAGQGEPNQPGKHQFRMRIFPGDNFHDMTTLKGLQRILRKRLPTINRWGMVTVYYHSHAPKFVKADPGTFVIVWDKPMRSNIHPYEYKQVPLEDIEKVADRNRMRLRNKTKEFR